MFLSVPPTKEGKFFNQWSATMSHLMSPFTILLLNGLNCVRTMFLCGAGDHSSLSFPPRGFFFRSYTSSKRAFVLILAPGSEAASARVAKPLHRGSTKRSRSRPVRCSTTCLRRCTGHPLTYLLGDWVQRLAQRRLASGHPSFSSFSYPWTNFLRAGAPPRAHPQALGLRYTLWACLATLNVLGMIDGAIVVRLS